MPISCWRIWAKSCACSARSCSTGQRCAAGTSTATDAVGCGLLHNVRKDQGYSIHAHVRWVLGGKYCSTGSVLGIIRLPRLPVRNCIKAQNEKKHWAGSGAAGTPMGSSSHLLVLSRCPEARAKVSMSVRKRGTSARLRRRASAKGKGQRAKGKCGRPTASQPEGLSVVGELRSSKSAAGNIQAVPACQ